MKLAFRHTIAWSLLSLFSLSCSKNESLVPTYTNLLTGTSWRLEAWSSTPAYRYTNTKGISYTTHNLFELADRCNRDDRYVFNKNQTYVYNEGTLLCNTKDKKKHINNGTWSVSTDETHLILDNVSYSIDKLTKSTLIVSYPYTKTDSIENNTYKYTFTETWIAEE